MENNVIVNVKTKYLANKSFPQKFYFLFSYKVNILNKGVDSVRLISRYWNIIDGDGNTEDIYGPGVVGQRPWIKKNEHYVYTSYCPLKTPIGKMGGTFQMTKDEIAFFDVPILHFELAATQELN
tara:strand:- start:75 stop:446 length:372 start_codon:yes stop_codon:yes gene_type:complete